MARRRNVLDVRFANMRVFAQHFKHKKFSNLNRGEGLLSAAARIRAIVP
jgi:hypothetical protein